MIRVVVADDHAVVRRGLTGLIESTEDLEVVGVARDGHQLLKGEVTAERYGAESHVQILRRGLHSSEVDQAAMAGGSQRPVGVVVNQPHGGVPMRLRPRTPAHAGHVSPT